MNYYLYKITNLINDKSYIGLTSNIPDRWSHHRVGRGSKVLKSAFEKYGIENFTFEILCVGSKAYIQELEIKTIQVFNTLPPFGYNLSTGGEAGGAGYSPTIETRQKLVTALRGRKRPVEVVQKISSANKGRKCSAESRKRMSAACMGRKHSPETCLKMSISRQKSVMVFGQIYPSILDAAMRLGYKPNTLSARLSKYKRQNKFPVGWGYIETVI